MTHLVFISTETTGLDPERHDIWEIALIVDGHPQQEFDGEYNFQVPHRRETADLAALKTSSYFERSLHWRQHTNPSDDATGYNVDPESGRVTEVPSYEIYSTVTSLTHDAHLVGAVPHFDATRLSQLLQKNSHLASWHYRLIDVETLAIGFLAGRALEGNLDAGFNLPSFPWNSDGLSWAVGVEPPSENDRHTALADARWARQVFYAVTGGRYEP